MSNTTGSAPHDFRLLGTRAINRLMLKSPPAAKFRARAIETATKTVRVHAEDDAFPMRRTPE
jgi:hypothetical protein